MILGAAFYAIATFLIEMVGGYLFQTKIDAEYVAVQALAEEYAGAFARGDTDALYASALEWGRDRGRVLILDMDGKVQVDTNSIFNGRRFAHTEVINVLNGAQADHGFHLLSRDGELNRVAWFDFLRAGDKGERWVGYFTQALMFEEQRVGVIFFSTSVQDMVDTLRMIQDQMLIIFIIVAAAVLVVSLIFSRIITRPIAALSESIQRMGKGDLSGRVKVTGHDEMARLGETYNQMSEKLENLDTSRNEFVSNASHELKTPLATMKIMLESMLYQDDMDPALRSEFLTDINMELDRLGNIVTDLLTLVQSDSHEYEPMRVETTLRELTEETLHRLEPLAVEKEQTISLSGQGETPVFVDPMKMQQAIYNIIENAVKYTPDGGTIRVVVKPEGKLAVLEVTDDGPGIPKKDQAHIFDRFYRVDRARSRATGGNGLGLSIAYQAVVMHDGHLSVRSEEGKGSTFRIELPIAS